MSQITIHVEATPSPEHPSGVGLRVVHQAPKINGLLPFEAQDGTMVTILPSGRPFAGVVGGRLTVGLRGPQCPDSYRNTPVVCRMPADIPVMQAARRIKTAIAELRQAANVDAAHSAELHNPAAHSCAYATA